MTGLLSRAAQLDPVRAASLAANDELLRTSAVQADARLARHFCEHRQQSGECPLRPCKEQQQ